jgi:hypothetical protein
MLDIEGRIQKRLGWGNFALWLSKRQGLLIFSQLWEVVPTKMGTSRTQNGTTAVAIPCPDPAF